MADNFSFVPTNYQPFQQATGYGYDDWLAQVRDAMSMPSRGAGIFGNLGGDNLPRYAFGNRPGGMPPPSGFNASSFLAPYLANLGGGTSGSPPAGAGAGMPGGGLLAGAATPGGARGLLGGGGGQQGLAAMIAQAIARGK